MDDQPFPFGSDYATGSTSDQDDLDSTAEHEPAPPGAFYRALHNALERLRHQPNLPPPSIA
jgi:hypothetical protein